MAEITTDRFDIVITPDVTLTFAPLNIQQIGRLASTTDDDGLIEPKPPEGYTREQAIANLQDFRTALANYQSQKMSMLAIRELGLGWTLAVERKLSADIEPLKKLLALHGLRRIENQVTPLNVGAVLADLLMDTFGTPEKLFEHYRWQQVVTGQIPEDQVQEVLKSLQHSGERSPDSGANGTDQPQAPSEGRTADREQPDLRKRRRGKGVGVSAHRISEALG